MGDLGRRLRYESARLLPQHACTDQNPTGSAVRSPRGLALAGVVETIYIGARKPDRPLDLSVAPDAGELKRVREAVRTYAHPLAADVDAVVLVANEAVSCALVAGIAYALVDGQATTGPIELELRPRGDALELSVRAPTPPPAAGWETDSDLAERLRLLSAFADRTEIRSLNQTVEIRATFAR